MNRIIKFFVTVWKIPDLRKKVIFTLAMIVVVRLFAHLTVPGVNANLLKDFFSRNEILQFLDIMSGGTLANFSVIALGLNPYINSSIIFQLLGLVFPKLEEMQKEGESGRQKINQYTRYLTVPLAAVQAFGMYVLLKSQSVITVVNPISILAIIVTMTAGTIFLMWLGELISENGIGNGISILIFAGIVGRLPVIIFQTRATVFSQGQLINLAILIVMAVLVIFGIVIITEGRRQILIQYAKRIKGDKLYGGQSTYLPLRVNQAGVIPIIFAVSLVIMPTTVANFLSRGASGSLANLGSWILVNFQQGGLAYNIIYFILVVGFTFFYTAVVFNPVKISDEIKKHGGFVPGIRPGSSTATYLNYILNRITLAGAIFLGMVAILPSIAQNITGITNVMLGGTGILIVVSVILETSKQIESMVVMRSYERFLK
jgi:preprotein translocase subunit SecY